MSLNAISLATPSTWQSLIRNEIAVAFAAVLGALIIGLLLIVMIGVPLSDAIGAFLDGAFGSGYAIAASINRATVFAAVGLGFIFANQANLTNVGGEGQIAVGGIAAAAVALKTPIADLQVGLAFMLPILAAVIAGAAWGGICGVLKVKVGTNEVISSLLLTFIGIWLLYWSVQSIDLLRQPMTNTATLPETLEIPDATKRPALLDVAGPLNIGLVFVVILAMIIGLALHRGVLGLRLRAAGLNELASRRAGIPYDRYVVLAMAVAGRSIRAQGRLHIGLWLRWPRRWPVGTGLQHRSRSRCVVFRLPALGRHQHGNDGAGAVRRGGDHPGFGDHCDRRLRLLAIS
jgi:ABC-type uncharacterized transport system permease subunit